MVKLIPLRNFILQKLALVIIILILSMVNIYIKGNWKTNNSDNDDTGQSRIINQQLKENNDNEIINNLKTINDHEKLTQSKLVGKLLLNYNNNDNNQENINNPEYRGVDIVRRTIKSIEENQNNQLNVLQSRRKRRNLLTINEKDNQSSPTQSTSVSNDETNGEIKVNTSEPIQPTKSPKTKTRKSKSKSKSKPSTEGEGSTSTSTTPTTTTTTTPSSTSTNETNPESGKPKTGKKKKTKSKKVTQESKNDTITESPVTIRSHLPPKTMIPLIKNVKIKDCTAPAYKEFPNDIFGNKARKHGAVIVHIAVACYMFYCLAIVCDHYFLTSLEECSSRLNLSSDVAGATLMAAGSSAPELFTAILGVFVAKGDVGTGTIVGSAVFNILFVIGLCGVLTASTVLTWWPVARDSSYYTFTVLVLILVSYDGEVTTFESALMLIFYVGYIVLMHFNHQIRDLVTTKLKERGFLATIQEEVGEIDEIKPQSQSVAYYQSMQVDEWGYSNQQAISNNYNNYNSYGNSYSNTGGYSYSSGLPPSMDPNKVSLYEAAQIVIIKHKRLFPAISRFRAAANYTISVNRKQNGSNNNRSQKQRQQQFNYKTGDGDSTAGLSKLARERITSSPNVDDWSLVPNPVVEGWLPVIRWCIIAPLHATLFYTIPNCKTRSNLFLATFLMSVFWIAVFSYIMVWMVTLVGFTFGIPDSIMGITFLAAGTSIPDAYASIHVARQGQGDMAVSNSIGSNVFDILVGLALPWFVETALWQPGTTASINSRGLFYAIILLFLSLCVTIFLFHHNNWTLNPKLGYALLATYAVFLVFCGALELNLLGYVNPVMCDE